MKTEALVPLRAVHLDPPPHIDRVQQQAILQFAGDNDFDYQEADPGLISRWTSRSGVPAWLGTIAWFAPKDAYHVVRGMIRGYEVTFFLIYEHLTNGISYSNPTPEQEQAYNRQQTRGIVRIKLPRVFPQILLDSNHNDRSSNSSIWVTYKSDQLLNLEGDFPSHFDLYAPRGLHLNVLTLLAPNMMEYLVQTASKLDVEFYGDELIFITKDALYSPETLEVIAQAMQMQLEYLERLVWSWEYTPLTPPFDTLKLATLSGSTMKIGRFRLTPARLVLLILFGFFLYALFILFLKQL